MLLTPEPVTLNLRTAFRIAHGVSQQRFNVFVHLDEGGQPVGGQPVGGQPVGGQHVGIGEGAVVPYYGDTQQGLLDYLAAAADRLGDDPFLIEDILDRLPPGPPAAKAALDIALHDLIGQRLHQPLYRLFGLNPDRLPLTSFTIAMDEPVLMAQRAAASSLPIIKIKLGSDQDEAMVAAIRGATSAKLRVDANAGWTREQAAQLIPRLKQYDIEFIEQPLAADDYEGLRWLKQQNLGVPIFADESLKTSRDIARHADAVDGVVIKLMKTGGLREALRAIHIARAHGLQIMLSCMVETSVGVTAAAHLAPLCDYADLDGPLLIANDPYQGVRFDGARLILPDQPGLGVTPA